MAGRTELIKEIDRLPQKYIGKVLDFVSHLQNLAQNDDDKEVSAYKAMAADTEREQEASEWCNSFFGPVNNK